MHYSTPHLQLRSNSIIAYWQPIEDYHQRKRLGKFKTYSGKVTEHARKRMLAALDVLVFRSFAAAGILPAAAATDPPKTDPIPDESKVPIMNFITLTLAEQKNLSVKECYDSLLRPFIRHMKRKEGMERYVWKAEYQTRGQVHYHIATDTNIPWKNIRWYWNKLQHRNRMLDGFYSKYKHLDPNGTDIHPMHSIVNCIEYISKEMCKDVQNQKVTKGKVWDCSESLKIGRYNSEMTEANQGLLDEAVQMGFADKIVTDNCIVFKMKEPTRVLDDFQYTEFKQHILSP